MPLENLTRERIIQALNVFGELAEQRKVELLIFILMTR